MNVIKKTSLASSGAAKSRVTSLLVVISKRRTVLRYTYVIRRCTFRGKTIEFDNAGYIILVRHEH